MDILLYNSLSKKKDLFVPLNRDLVGVYTCGPTVYNTASIGNFRAFLFADLLVRTLRFNGLEVKWVMNITDVGHLTDDADQGEDKMEKGSREQGMTAWEIAQTHTDEFYLDMDRFHIVRPDVLPKATDHIQEQVDLIQILEKKGHTYTISDGVYFDTSTIFNYGVLRGSIEPDKKEARIEENREKKHSADFALWKFSSQEEHRQMEWDSPWGVGFPGWHIECTAMSMKELGDLFDIHTGGVDHKMIHHPNEMAQAQGSKGTSEARVWMHNEFLLVDGGKMSKSLGNVYTAEQLREHGFDPVVFRYLILTAHYRQQLNFTWDSLAAAQSALKRLRCIVREWEMPSVGSAEYEVRFLEAVNNDLDTPRAIALVWELVNDSTLAGSSKAQTLKKWDAVLGLGLLDYIARPLVVSDEVQKLVDARARARLAMDWEEGDTLRAQIAELGYHVDDTADGQKLSEL
ncbi:TPA: cysteine--tRNA ligase [Candidatus Uhrbacteria bacterium]|nr:cysteine--tRNA ligase [Candidatus Uhrbacteria bacterium]